MLTKFRVIGKRWLIGGIVVTGCLSACSFLEKKQAVVIDKEPMSITRHSLEQAPIRLQDQSEKEEGALTTWFYRCSNYLAYEVKSETRSKNLVSVEILITGATMHIGLAVDMFLKEDAPASLKAHEAGHLRICELIYQKADSAAAKAARGVLGRKFSGAGSDHNQALAAALQAASEAICSSYRGSTVIRANKTSSAYDRITDHGRAKISGEEAINQALKQEEL
jgi:hypothetical protein